MYPFLQIQQQDRRIIQSQHEFVFRPESAVEIWPIRTDFDVSLLEAANGRVEANGSHKMMVFFYVLEWPRILRELYLIYISNTFIWFSLIFKVYWNVSYKTT